MEESSSKGMVILCRSGKGISHRARDSQELVRSPHTVEGTSSKDIANPCRSGKDITHSHMEDRISIHKILDMLSRYIPAMITIQIPRGLEEPTVTVLSQQRMADLGLLP